MYAGAVMRNRSFLINFITLTATALLLRVIGIYLSALLSRHIGAEGLGLYQLIFSVYIFASALSSSGFSQAVSRMAAEAVSRESGPPSAIVRQSCALGVAISAVVAAALIARRSRRRAVSRGRTPRNRFDHGGEPALYGRFGMPAGIFLGLHQGRSR